MSVTTQSYGTASDQSDLRHVKVLPAIDSIDLDLPKPRLPAGVPKMLNKLQRMGVKVKDHDVVDGSGNVWRKQIYLSRSSVSIGALDLIEELQEKCQATLTRADISFAVAGMPAHEAAQRIGRSVDLKYRRRIGRNAQIGETRYLNPKNANRNVITYTDREKQWVTGDRQQPLWIELRFNSKTLRARGWNDVADLRQLDLKALFASIVHWKRSEGEWHRLIEAQCRRGNWRNPAYGISWKRRRLWAYVNRFDLVGGDMSRQQFLDLIPSFPFAHARGILSIGSMRG